MKNKQKKFKLLYKRQLITLLAVFFAAILLGFVGESKQAQTSDLLTRRALFAEMSGVVRRLNPILQPEIKTSKAVLPKIEIDNGIRFLYSAGIAKNFPDGSLGLNDRLTRGEALYYLHGLLNYIVGRLTYPQFINPVLNNYEDIKADHWLSETVNDLAGIGALQCLGNIKLYPDKQMELSQLRDITTRMVDYFSSNMLLLYKEPGRIKAVLKGAMKAIKLKNWQLSFDNEQWYKMPKDGVLPLAAGKEESFSLFFKHPLFLPIGPVEFSPAGYETAFVKLTRDYVSLTKTNLEKLSLEVVENDKDEVARVKKRLAELKQRYLGVKVSTAKQADEIDLTPVYSEKSIAAKGFTTNDPEPVSQKVKASHNYLSKQHREKKSNDQHSSEKKVLVSGKIIDSLTQEPLTNAMLVVEGESCEVGVDGRFEFAKSRDEIVELTVYCEGYSVLQMKHRVGYRSRELALRLKPELVSFNGKIISSISGQPVAHALVKVGTKATRSGKDGRFKVKGLKTGYHQVSCFVTNFLEAHQIVVVSENQTEPFVLELKPVD